MVAKIMAGKRGKKSRRVRQEDIAERVGFSLSTVSRALTGEKGVRADIRERILKAAKDLNYAIPTQVTGKKVILVASSAAMIDYIRNQSAFYILEGLKERARALDIEIAIHAISDQAGEKILMDEAKADPDVAGLIFLAIDDEGFLTAPQGFDKPVILINGDDPYMRHSSVAPCDRSAAHLAADYLIRLGHERILFLMCPGRRMIDRRREGWQDAYQLHGLECPPDLIVSVDDWLPELAAQAIIDRLKKAKELDFSAVLAVTDGLAVGAILGLQQMGYSVPGDASVMGMDDLPQAVFLNPPLTTVHIPTRELGSVVLDLMRDSIAGRTILARRVEIACHIAERQSTGSVQRGLGLRQRSSHCSKA